MRACVRAGRFKMKRQSTDHTRHYLKVCTSGIRGRFTRLSHHLSPDAPETPPPPAVSLRPAPAWPPLGCCPPLCVCLVWTFHTSSHTLRGLCEQLLSLSTFPRLGHVAVCVSVAFFFTAFGCAGSLRCAHPLVPRWTFSLFPLSGCCEFCCHEHSRPAVCSRPCVYSQKTQSSV